MSAIHPSANHAPIPSFSKASGISASTGHRAGADKIARLLEWCDEAGVELVTLWLLSTDGKEQKPLTNTTGKNSGPKWSPDGKSIAYRAQARAGFEADRNAVTLIDETGETVVPLSAKVAVAGRITRPRAQASMASVQRFNSVRHVASR